MDRQPRVFTSRTTAGLKACAEQVAEVLRHRGIEPIIQTGSYPSLHDGKGLLAGHFQRQFTNCYGKNMGGKNMDSIFCHPSFCHQNFSPPADPARGLKQAIEAIKFEITVLAGKPTNLPYTSLGSLFKDRDVFFAELRQHLTAEGPVVIKGKRTIHGMGGVGKTRAAIEYAWMHADDYRAFLFISADTPEALHRNLAAFREKIGMRWPSCASITLDRNRCQSKIRAN